MKTTTLPISIRETVAIPVLAITVIVAIREKPNFRLFLLCFEK